MYISQKCQYAVRAVLELAKYTGKRPLKTSDIAARQAIPERFLGIILNELKASGVVEARRGVQGGFLLAVKPSELTVGRVIRLVEGPLDPVKCTAGGEGARNGCPLHDKCSLLDLWSRAKAAVEEVYDGTNFQELAERELAMDGSRAGDYTI